MGVILIEDDIDAAWVTTTSFLIFLMQLGLGFLEAGYIKYKNINNILLKHILDTTLVGVFWWLFGYQFAFGHSQYGFLGVETNLIAFSQTDDTLENRNYYIHWFSQWQFCCIAIIIAHWGWNKEGWLTKQGYIDFVGSSFIHMFGGMAGFVGTIMLGPRKHRFEDVQQQQSQNESQSPSLFSHSRIMQSEQEELKKDQFHPQSIPFIVLGTLFIWFGWYGFNCGSTYKANTPKSSFQIGLISMNISLSCAAGGITCFLRCLFKVQNASVSQLIMQLSQGLMAGLVGINGCCDNIYPYSALVIGILSGFIYIGSSKLLRHYKIDDPLGTASIHFFVGFFATIFTGLFHYEKGLFYGNTQLIQIQLLGLVCLTAWDFGVHYILFTILKKLNMLNNLTLDEHKDQIKLVNESKEERIKQYELQDIIKNQNNDDENKNIKKEI